MPIDIETDIAMNDIVLEVLTILSQAKTRSVSYEIFDVTIDQTRRKRKDYAEEKMSNMSVSKLELRIYSQELASALRATISNSEGQAMLNKVLAFSEPFMSLVHHKADLQQCKSRHPETHSQQYRCRTDEHVGVLLGFLDKHCGHPLSDEQARHARSPPVCTYEYLWLLYKPGDICYRREEYGQFSTFMVKGISGGIPNGIAEPYMLQLLRINIWNVALGWELIKQEIEPFDGEQNVASLKVAPMRFHIGEVDQTKATVAERLIARGKIFWE